MANQCEYCGAEDECDCKNTISMWQYREMKTAKEQECESLRLQIDMLNKHIKLLESELAVALDN